MQITSYYVSHQYVIQPSESAGTSVQLEAETQAKSKAETTHTGEALQAATDH